jgi:hypothetical protein
VRDESRAASERVRAVMSQLAPIDAVPVEQARRPPVRSANDEQARFLSRAAAGAAA